MKFLLFSFFLIVFNKTISSLKYVENYPQYKIGGLFHNKIDESAFRLASYLQNQKHSESYFTLVPEASQISHFNAYDVFMSTCAQLRKGVIGIFGPSSCYSSSTIQAICDRKEIPHIETHWNSNLDRSNCLINLHPHSSILSKVFVDLIVKWNWNRVSILYEDSESTSKIEPLLALNVNYGIGITLRPLEQESPGNYRPMLTAIKNIGERHFIIDCSIETLKEVLKQAQQVGMMTDNYNYIITNLDLQTVDLEPFQYGGTNITGLRMINPENFEIRQMAKLLKLYQINEEEKDEIIDEDLAAWKLRLNTALIIDSIQLFYETIKELTESEKLILNVKPVICNNTDNWESGHTIINYMKGKSINGLSGNIRFNTEGFRTEFSLDVMELTKGGLIKIGTWDTWKGLQIERVHTQEIVKSEEGSMANKTFTVITCLTTPYGMLKETAVQLTGNDRFEGYGIDLIQELANMLGFNYTFIIQNDGDNGNFDPVTGKWSGLIGAVIEGRADMAIADLTVTAEREEAVDFTMQFMNLGISILYRKPEPVPPSLFMFASPFSIQVWLLLGVAYLLVSLSFFIMARISPGEWNNPYPCIEEPEYLFNQFSIKNSLWFTVGSLMQQGSELAPISISTRTAAGVWWFFVLIMVSSYTANLAAFLTVETFVTSFNNIEELANQNEIKYGAKRDGSTANFFRDSKDPIRKKIWHFMHTHPECMTSDNDEGVNKVKNENYAYFMESTTIEYVIERHCSLARVGNLLDDKGYAIALKKNSPYRNELSKAILKLQEMGKLAALKVKWWKEKRGAGNCDTKEESEATPLDLKNVGGVFLVLFLGTLLGCITSIIEMLYYVYKKSKKLKVSFEDCFRDELNFYFDLKKTMKKCHSLDNLD